MRSIQAGDVNGDGKMDLVAGALASGALALRAGRERGARGSGRSSTPSRRASSTVSTSPTSTATAARDLRRFRGSARARQYRWENGTFAKTVLAPLAAGDITWNVTDAKL
jgi:hypothetical protein